MTINRVLAIGAIAAASMATGVFAQNIVRIASPNKVTTLDPIASAAAGNIEAFGQLYSRLLRKNIDGTLEPGLAKSWTISEDGLTYTFELRDAKFSDGSVIAAEDVAFSLNRVARDKGSAYPAAYAPLTEVKALDVDTVVMTLKHPSAPMLSNMEIFNAGIISKDDIETRGEKAFAANPVVSGPFMVEVWKPNDRLTLKANPNYWRVGYPKVAGADLIEVEDDNTRSSMIMAGEIDASRGVPFAQVEEINANAAVSVPLEQSTQVYSVMPNHGKPPFDNLNVRKAAAMALNREAMAKALTQGKAKVANSTIPGALNYHSSDISPPAYDPAGARKLLETEGKLGTEITLTVGPAFKQAATLLKAQWDAVGFKTTIENVDGGLWWDRLTKGEYDVTFSWWYNETLDPDLAVRWAVCGSCGNKSYFTNYNNEKVNQLVEAALRERDDAKRSALYGEIQKISTEELAQIPLYYPPMANAYSNRIKGLTLTPSLQWTLEETEIVK